jgi:hypothetical protein
MIERDIIVDMRKMLTAQRAILHEADTAVSAFERSLSDTDMQAHDINDLAAIMSDIEKNADFLEPYDLEGLAQDDSAITALYKQSNTCYRENLKTLQFSSWPQFVRDSQSYCLTKGIETVLPWEAMLTDDDFAQIKMESYEAQYRWDKWDYIVVGSAGVLAFLTDVFLVAIPKTMTSGVYNGQQGSIVTEKLRSFRFPQSVQSWLEMKAKVPYDHTGGGDHRIDTFGHDPVLGFIMGTLDIIRGGTTTIKGGKIAFEAGLADPVNNPLTALITQFLHMLSDATTSKGLPVPFASIIRALKVGSFRGPSGRTHTLSEMILWMYHHGYDLRHFVTMGITPATIEIILRAYLMIRHYSIHGDVKFLLADNPKYRSMLLSAHAVACAGNAGKVALMQGNPLAINYAEWIALLRYLIPSLKYWLFDKRGLRMEHMLRINEQGWSDLCQSSDDLLKRVYTDTAPVFVLGAGST